MTFWQLVLAYVLARAIYDLAWMLIEGRTNEEDDDGPDGYA